MLQYEYKIKATNQIMKLEKQQLRSEWQGRETWQPSGRPHFF